MKSARWMLHLLAISLVGLTAVSLEIFRNSAAGRWAAAVFLLLAGAAAVETIIRHDAARRKVRQADSEKRQRSAVQHKVIQGQEQERMRISRELHDGIGQSLYSIFVGLKIVNQLKIDESVKEHLLEVERTTKEVMDEIKNMASQLRPPMLDDLGLIPALRSYLESYERQHGIEVESELAHVRDLDFAVTTALYRICQEALRNAAKYSDTRKVLVKLADQGDRIVMTIQDFGQGFELSESERERGIGLYSMRERAEALQGQLDIVSGRGNGTKIVVQIPRDN